MATTKLSPAQQRFMDAVDAAGPNGYRSPAYWDKASVRAGSAWHRTCQSLMDRGLVTTTHNGNTYWARRVR